jgi:hypothetical protein
MNVKGRKVYEGEVEKIKTEIGKYVHDNQILSAQIRAFQGDMIPLFKGGLLKAIKLLIKYRREYKNKIKEETNNLTDATNTTP